MNHYIALLRGINVSGYNKIKMDELKTLFEKVGFTNVQTYIQSGNVIFTSESSDSISISNKLKAAIQTSFKLTIEVLVLSKNKLETIYNANPFFENKELDITKLAITFLKTIPSKNKLIELENFKNKFEDEFYYLNGSIYLFCKNGFARTKLTNNFFEKKLQCVATTRNLKTTNKLVELSSLI